MQKKIFVLISFLLLGILVAVPVFAEIVKWNGVAVDADDVPKEYPAANIVNAGTDLDEAMITPSWGTSDWITYTIGAADFVRRDSCSFNGTPDMTNLNGILPASGQSSICVGAPVHLPQGARLQVVRLIYNDTHPTSDPSMGFWALGGYGPAEMIVDLSPDSFSGGNRFVDFDVNHTINNFNTYYVLAILDRSVSVPAELEKIYEIRFWYRLQISPAPGTATFSDVPVGSFWHQYIEALAASGITTGFPDGTFRPDVNVTRGQMAAFLARALGLHWPN